MDCLKSCLFLLVILHSCPTALAAVEPIWMSPTNVTNDPKSDFENLSAGLGVWATISNGAGPRGFGSVSVMDSKGTLWIMFGRRIYYNDNLYTVWNYDPKTDQYCYVWKANLASVLDDPRKPGQLGVPALTNHPGYIGDIGVAITRDDNIWFTAKSELWMFNTTSWMFVRMQGWTGTGYNENLGETKTDTPSKGSNPGQPGADVWPGYTESHHLLVDSQDNIWLVHPYYNFGDGKTDTVWHFDTTSRLWTFISGTLNPGTGQQTSTFFGGTTGSGCDIDENDRIWIYGGWGLGPNNQVGDYGNIWTYDTREKRTWEFEYGSDNTFKIRPSVVSDDFHPDNRPSASDNSLFIDRLDGTMLLVTGYGYDTNYNYGGSNTMWLYKKSSKQWKLITGDIDSVETAGAYTNYREPGSKYPSTVCFAKFNSKNAHGDVFVVGGGTRVEIYNQGLWRKDIWLVPQDQCTFSIDRCDPNADCIEQLVGYTCECREGFTCVNPPIISPPPLSPKSPTSPGAAPSVKSPSGSPGSSIVQPPSTGTVSFVSVASIVVSGLVLAMV